MAINSGVFRDMEWLVARINRGAALSFVPSKEGMKKDFSRLQIQLTGPPNARRYFIHKEDGQMWGSNGWTDHLQDAILFHRLLDCYEVIKQIEDREMAGEKYRDYVVPLTIRVYADEELDDNVIVEYIRRACRMCFDYEAFGPGPGPASIIQLGVRWGQFRREES